LNGFNQTWELHVFGFKHDFGLLLVLYVKVVAPLLLFTFARHKIDGWGQIQHVKNLFVYVFLVRLNTRFLVDLVCHLNVAALVELVNFVLLNSLNDFTGGVFPKVDFEHSPVY